MSLRRQIWVVLLSYLTRTGFRWAIISGLSGFGLILIGVGWGSLLHRNHLNENPFEFLIMIGLLAIEGSLLAALIVFFAHARRQLMGPTTRLMPNTRRAHLIVSAGFFFAIVLAMSSPGSEDGMFYPGVLLCVLFLMTLIACAVCNPWLTPLPVTALLLLSSNMQTQLIANYIMQEWNLSMFPNETPRRLAYLTEHLHYIWALRGLLLLLNILALICLERLARPRRGGSLLQNARRISAFFNRGSRASTLHRHRVIQNSFARVAHRRIAVHDWRVSVFVAIVIAVLTGVICHSTAPGQSNPVTSIVAMLAILPGSLAAIGWRNRWGSYDFETLYPARHPQFVSELVAVLLIDLIEYWVVGLTATLLAILQMRSYMLHDPELWTAISGSAMMQVLWVGGIVLAGQRRQTVPFAAGLGIAVMAMLLAFDNLRQSDSRLFPSHFIAISTIEMLVGFLFLAIATLVWRRRAAT